jgi:hypothetical protein
VLLTGGWHWRGSSIYSISLVSGPNEGMCVTDWWNWKGSPLYCISLVSGPNEGMCVTEWWMELERFTSLQYITCLWS